MDTPQVQSAATPVPEIATYVGFWRRFVAFFIDSLILGIIGYAFFGGVSQVNTQEGVSISVSYTGWKSVIPLIYYFVFWVWLAATPGKLVMGIKIVEEGGKKLSIKGALLRIIGYILSAVVFFIGFIWIAFDKKKQGWHDKIAGTYVVRK